MGVPSALSVSRAPIIPAWPDDASGGEPGIARNPAVNLRRQARTIGAARRRPSGESMEGVG